MALNMYKQHYTDEEIIEGIRESSGPLLHYLFRRYLPGLKKMMRQKGAKQKDAEEVFREALTVIFLKLREPHFELTVQFDTFLYAVCKRQLFYRNRKDTRIISDDFGFSDMIREDSLEKAREKVELFHLFKKYIDQLGGQCSEILKGHLKGWNNAKIGAILGLSEVFVRQQKLLCKKALKEIISKDSKYKGDFEF